MQSATKFEILPQIVKNTLFFFNISEKNSFLNRTIDQRKSFLNQTTYVLCKKSIVATIFLKSRFFLKSGLIEAHKFYSQYTKNIFVFPNNFKMEILIFDHCVWRVPRWRKQNAPPKLWLQPNFIPLKPELLYLWARAMLISGH